MSVCFGKLPFPSYTLVRSLCFGPWFLVRLGQRTSYWRIPMQQKLMEAEEFKITGLAYGEASPGLLP